MTAKEISFIVPVYNRPEEINELLQSFSDLKGDKDFEIVVIEDGSDKTSKNVVENFKSLLTISYFFKKNTGPGDSRNFGMQNAKGSYFIILDSDCLLPENYLIRVLESLNTEFVDCFGGPDAAHHSFTNLQKAIDFTMTSFITTGGIRGKRSSVYKFQPRSFNMGISKKAFEATNGFGSIHPGEDPDLAIRLWKLGFSTKLIPEAYVFHKRRISWSKFYKQVNKFGKARPILNRWHPKTKNVAYWFPLFFSLGFVASLVLWVFNFKWLCFAYLLYFTVFLVLALIQSKSIIVSFMALIAMFIQFYGYGLGFITSTLKLMLSTKDPEVVLPEMFFKQ